jgi:hypothetical protein
MKVKILCCDVKHTFYRYVTLLHNTLAALTTQHRLIQFTLVLTIQYLTSSLQEYKKLLTTHET